MKYKVGKKVFSFFFLVFLVAFLVLYFSFKTGYIEYQNQKKMIMTKEAIAKFEEDVASGKEVDIKSYLPEDNSNYQNAISNAGFKVSSFAKNCVEKAVESSFKALSKLAE